MGPVGSPHSGLSSPTWEVNHLLLSGLTSSLPPFPPKSCSKLTSLASPAKCSPLFCLYSISPVPGLIIIHGGNTLIVVLNKMYFLYLLTHGALLFIWRYDPGSTELPFCFLSWCLKIDNCTVLRKQDAQ